MRICEVHKAFPIIPLLKKDKNLRKPSVTQFIFSFSSAWFSFFFISPVSLFSAAEHPWRGFLIVPLFQLMRALAWWGPGDQAEGLLAIWPCESTKIHTRKHKQTNKLNVCWGACGFTIGTINAVIWPFKAINIVFWEYVCPIEINSWLTELQVTFCFLGYYFIHSYILLPASTQAVILKLSLR